MNPSPPALAPEPRSAAPVTVRIVRRRTFYRRAYLVIGLVFAGLGVLLVWASFQPSKHRHDESTVSSNRDLIAQVYCEGDHATGVSLTADQDLSHYDVLCARTDTDSASGLRAAGVVAIIFGGLSYLRHKMEVRAADVAEGRRVRAKTGVTPPGSFGV